MEEKMFAIKVNVAGMESIYRGAGTPNQIKSDFADLAAKGISKSQCKVLPVIDRPRTKVIEIEKTVRIPVPVPVHHVSEEEQLKASTSKIPTPVAIGIGVGIGVAAAYGGYKLYQHYQIKKFQKKKEEQEKKDGVAGISFPEI